MWIAEVRLGALASIQSSSYVTVGNYPGIEAPDLRGSEGAVIVRLVGRVPGAARPSRRRPRRRRGVHRRRDPGTGTTSRPAATPASPGNTSSTPTWWPTSSTRSATTAGQARATSPRARWCRRPSTHSRRRTAPGRGPASRWRPREGAPRTPQRLVGQVLAGEVWPPLADPARLPGRARRASRSRCRAWAG